MRLWSLTAAVLLSATTAFAQSIGALADGKAARADWEQWLSGQTGDFRAGVDYWASHRSLKMPPSCMGPQGQSMGAMTDGCLAAQARLAPIDKRRKAEPDYKTGFNTYEPVAASAVAPPSPSANQKNDASVALPPSVKAVEKTDTVMPISVKPNRDTELCPSAETLFVIQTFRESRPNQAADYATSGHCLTALSASTIQSLNGNIDAVSYRLLTNYENGMAIVETIMTAPPFVGGEPAPIHTAWFGFATDFSPIEIKH